MTRDELAELLMHAEIDDVEISGPPYGPETIDEMRLRFRWPRGETRSVRLVGTSDVCGWIDIEEA